MCSKKYNKKCEKVVFIRAFYVYMSLVLGVTHIIKKMNKVTFINGSPWEIGELTFGQN